jgi:hypothetical protein
LALCRFNVSALASRVGGFLQPGRLVGEDGGEIGAEYNRKFPLVYCMPIKRLQLYEPFHYRNINYCSIMVSLVEALNP